jgi:hypothetical protein
MAKSYNRADKEKTIIFDRRVFGGILSKFNPSTELSSNDGLYKLAECAAKWQRERMVKSFELQLSFLKEEKERLEELHLIDFGNNSLDQLYLIAMSGLRGKIEILEGLIKLWKD